MTAIMAHIFTFLYHMTFFSDLDDFWNLRADWFSWSLLSTSNSIFSPRASTCGAQKKGGEAGG